MKYEIRSKLIVGVSITLLLVRCAYTSLPIEYVARQRLDSIDTNCLQPFYM